jgi:hypothetical protein
MQYFLYNSKPQTVRAVRFTGNNTRVIRPFMDGAPHQFRMMNDGKFELDIPTRKGMKTVRNGQYITCDEEGEFRVWTEEEFTQNFDPTGSYMTIEG